MYSARIETNSGEIFNFGYEHGVLFDISPLSGVDVDIATSQGFQQMGETVEGLSVSGLSRTISGVILSDAVAREMLSKLSAFDEGRLYVNESSYCDIVIQKTPTIVREKSANKLRFTMMVFCATPFWLSTAQKQFVVSGFIPAFSFPVDYSEPHKFAESNPAATINAVNRGSVRVPFTLRITSTFSVENPGIVNVNTLETIRLKTTLQQDDDVLIWRENGRIRVTNRGENALGILDENSDLMYIEPGDNLLQAVADSSILNMRMSVAFNEAETGVLG